MSSIHTEHAFEAAIEHDLISHRGYLARKNTCFDPQYALDLEALFSFLHESQRDEWVRLQGIHEEQVRAKFLYRLDKEIRQRGMLDVLRKGITDMGVKFKLAYFRPASGLNPDTQRLYELNKLYAMRQVYYSLDNKKLSGYSTSPEWYTPSDPRVEKSIYGAKCRSCQAPIYKRPRSKRVDLSIQSTNLGSFCVR